jgi:hypothetical protein
LEAGSRSAPGATGPGGGGAASQKGRPAGRGEKEGEGVEDKKEGKGVEDKKEMTTEGIEEQRAFLYTGQAARGRVPRSGEAKPNAAADRQRDYRTSSARYSMAQISTLTRNPSSMIKVFRESREDDYCAFQKLVESMALQKFAVLPLLKIILLFTQPIMLSII